MKAQELFEWENAYSRGNDGKFLQFEIISPFKMNIRFSAHFWNERLPERYNKRDNIYQFFQCAASDILLYHLSGAISLGRTFLLAGKIDGTTEWPVFCCAVKDYDASHMNITVVTFMIKDSEVLLNSADFCTRKFLYLSSNGGDKQAIDSVQQVIIADPYATEKQRQGADNFGNTIDSFYKIGVTCTFFDKYKKSEFDSFNCAQNGRSAMGFIKKAQSDIINAIKNGVITKGNNFKVQSKLENPYYCTFIYDGIHLKRKCLMFAAVIVSSNPNNYPSAPVVSKIDTGEKFVPSKEIVKDRQRNIEKIGAGILDNTSNLEQGAEFKIPDEWREREKSFHDSAVSRMQDNGKITVAESTLRKLISEAIIRALFNR